MEKDSGARCTILITLSESILKRFTAGAFVLPFSLLGRKQICQEILDYSPRSLRADSQRGAIARRERRRVV